MSLLGPLRASSSRLPLSTIAGSAGIHTTAYRAATAAQQKEAKKPGWTVQDVDEQLGKMQKQQEQMKKSGQHFDFYSINVPVLERIAEPPASPSWVFKTGGWKWLKERAMRYRQDRQFLNEMIKRNAFPKRKGATFATSIYHSIMCLRPSYKAGALVEDLTQVWERYNAAQARGDEFALRETSTGTALSTARSLARSKLRMTWSLVSHHTEPKVLSARLAPIDLDGKIEIAQVALRFDATQVLEISKGAQKSRKEQRSVENWVFERHLPARTGWRVKERLDTTTPSVQL